MKIWIKANNHKNLMKGQEDFDQSNLAMIRLIPWVRRSVSSHLRSISSILKPLKKK